MLKFPGIVYRNHFVLPSLPPPNTFNGQTILITGATGGLGLATAVHFVNLGAASVIITARTETKGQAAKSQIEQQTGTKGKDVVKVMQFEMDTFAATKAFADRIKREVRSIDYVLLNAGVYYKGFRPGKDGFEDSIQVNVLSTALLALELLPWIKTAGKGRAHLGFVTSGNHRGVVVEKKFPESDVLGFFGKEENYPAGGMYPVNKLMEQYVVNEIAKLAVGPDGRPQVIVNPMCPGMVATDLGRDFRAYVPAFIFDGLMGLIMKSCEAGARTPVLAALTPPEENGKYITHYQSDKDYKIAAEKSVFGPQGQKMQAQVWKEVVGILVEKFPEVKEIVHPVS